MAEAAFAPPKFRHSDSNSAVAAAWIEYKADMENYLVAADMEAAPDKRKIAILLYGMGSQYRTTFSTFTFTAPDESKDNYAHVLEKFDNHFEPKKLIKLYMKKFDKCVQEEGETIASYIARLRDLAKKCEYGACLDNMLCKQISTGVRRKELRDKLWGEDLTLAQIINKCHLFEQQKESQNVLDDTTSSRVNVVNGRNYLRNYDRRQRRNRQHQYRQADQQRSQMQGNQNRGNPPNRNSNPQNRNGNPPNRNGTQSHQRGHQQNRTGNQSQRNQSRNCNRCGTQHRPRNCPAYGARCTTCGFRNHFARMCQTIDRLTNSVNNVSVNTVQNDYYDNDNYFDDANQNDDGYECDQNDYECDRNAYDDDFDDKYVWMNDVNVSKLWNKCFKLSNSDCEISFKLDTAAESSVISKKAFDALKCKESLPVRQSTIRLLGFGNQPVYPVGSVNVPIVHNDKVFHVDCEIVNGNVPNVLSLKHCIEMNLVKLVNDNKSASKVKINWPDNVANCKQSSARKVLDEHAEVFKGLGKVPGVVSLKVSDKITPVAHPPRPVPAALRKAVQDKLAELENEGIIEKIPVGEPSPWCSALHVVPKKDGSVRLTIDPKDLNKALEREFHPTTTVEEVARKCGPAKYFTVLDANSGYFQLVLDEESKNYTAFNTPFGRYRYLRLPMGITSAPELFQRKFGDIFGHIEGLHIIMDDFLIASDTLEGHNRILKQTLQVAKENNVTFSARKTQLCADSVVYSGHKFTKNGLALDPERVIELF